MHIENLIVQTYFQVYYYANPSNVNSMRVKIDHQIAMYPVLAIIISYGRFDKARLGNTEQPFAQRRWQ